MVKEREKICVILGAGASHDVKGEGTPDDKPQFQPPLANLLFDTRNQATWEIMNRYAGARYIANLLPNELRRRGGLEDCLKYYADHSDEAIRRHYLHIPPYLRDLLYHCGQEYIPDPSSYIELVNELLSVHSFEVLFLVLNYDNLLERALTHYDAETYAFSELGQYINSNRPAKVVKLHGSINWFRAVTRRPNEPWESAILAEDVLGKHPDSEIMVIDRVSHTFDNQGANNWLYPILTAPLAGKGQSDVVCPKSHRDYAQEFLRVCQRVLIIGTSGFDSDLLELMRKSIPANLPQFLHFVGQDKNPTEMALERFINEIDAFRIQKSVVSEFSDGFRNYLVSNLRGFAERFI